MKNRWFVLMSLKRYVNALKDSDAKGLFRGYDLGKMMGQNEKSNNMLRDPVSLVEAQEIVDESGF